MSDTQHTPEPWRLDENTFDAFGCDVLVRPAPPHGALIASFNKSICWDRETQIANAQRAVACVNYCRGLPTAALEVRTAGEELRAIKAKFDAMKATAYKLPNKCECSGSVACVCCNLLAEIGELEEALSLGGGA